MLKQHYVAGAVIDDVPAAFRRLCVETRSSSSIAVIIIQPPSGGCVLKQTCEGKG